MPLSVQVASGRKSFTTGAATTSFDRLRSATMNVKLPAAGTVFANPTTSAEPGAFYRGLLVGVTGAHGVVRPLAAHWPDGKGRFSLLLPPSVRGTVLHFWESDFVTFSRTPAAPGSAVDLSAWPSALPVHVPRDVGLLPVKR